MCVLGLESTKAGIRCVGMSAFELTEAQSRAVDDRSSRMDCSTQHMESGLDAHDQHGMSSVAFYKDV